MVSYKKQGHFEKKKPCQSRRVSLNKNQARAGRLAENGISDTIEKVEKSRKMLCHYEKGRVPNKKVRLRSIKNRDTNKKVGLL